MTRARLFLFAVSMFVAGMLAAQLLREPSSPVAAVDPPADPPRSTDLTEDELRGISVFRNAAPAVVHITTVALRRDFFFDIFQIPRGSGTGFFWGNEGHIVTNYHVVEDGDRFSVTLADHSDWDAELIGIAPEKDLAILRIDAPRSRLHSIELGTSNDLMVGQKVLALGNPFGLDHTLTVGVVSALDRELQSPAGRKIRDVIQTDAAINPGNSGGPLLDSRGRLVGVNTAIYSPSGGSSGIGFAIPVDTVRRLVPQLIEHGRPIESGIDGAFWLSDRQTRYFGLEGVVVREVRSRSQADRIGLQGIRVDRRNRWILGDTIVAVDGQPVRAVDDLRDHFESVGVGGEVTLVVERDGKRREVTLELRRVG